MLMVKKINVWVYSVKSYIWPLTPTLSHRERELIGIVIRYRS
jgi:hypothetical protein